jgi:simple sugar transport system ATP-binding protein
LIAVADAGGAVLVISEDLDELLEICDRILVMVAGRLIAELSAADATRTKLGELMTGAIEKEEQ